MVKKIKYERENLKEFESIKRKFQRTATRISTKLKQRLGPRKYNQLVNSTSKPSKSVRKSVKRR